jgi:DNA polymerase-3 subunit delta
LPKDKNELYKYLTKQKYVQHFKLLSNTEVINWAKKEVEARGGKISQQAVRELTSLLGSDLWQINNEIDKLLSYKLGKEEKLVAGGEPAMIEFEDVKTLVRGSFDENIFALTDAIGNGNKSLAIKLFDEQVEAGLTDSYLITMIIRQFKIIMQIKEALEQGNTSRKIINLLKLHPFVVQKGIGQARNFSQPIVKNILNQLIEIDASMKTGKGETKVMLNILMARL